MHAALRIIASATTAISIGLSGVVASAEELRIGTASQGGAFYPVGQAISSLVNNYAEGLTMVPVVTQGL